MKKEKKPIKISRINPDRFFDEFMPTNFHRSRFGFFDEFEDQFRRMEQYMNQRYNGMIQGKAPVEDKENMRIYGWTYQVGPDGQPHIKEFGNTPSMQNMTPVKQQRIGEREPLIDIQEGEKEIYVTAELPGVEKKDINLEISENILKINVNSEKHPFFKELKLSTTLNENKTDASYNNGVLSITLEKQKSKKKGKKINIK